MKVLSSSGKKTIYHRGHEANNLLIQTIANFVFFVSFVVISLVMLIHELFRSLITQPRLKLSE